MTTAEGDNSAERSPLVPRSYTASLDYGTGEIRLTEDQNVIIVGLSTTNLDRFKADPLLQRFPLKPGAIAAGTVSCTGNTYCSFGLTNTKDQAIAAAKKLDADLELHA